MNRVVLIEHEYYIFNFAMNVSAIAKMDTRLRLDRRTFVGKSES